MVTETHKFNAIERRCLWFYNLPLPEITVAFLIQEFEQNEKNVVFYGVFVMRNKEMPKKYILNKW